MFYVALNLLESIELSMRKSDFFLGDNLSIEIVSKFRILFYLFLLDFNKQSSTTFIIIAINFLLYFVFYLFTF